MYLKHTEKWPKHFYKMHFDPLYLRGILKNKRPAESEEKKIKLKTLLSKSGMEIQGRNNKGEDIFPSSGIPNKRFDSSDAPFYGISNQRSPSIDSLFLNIQSNTRDNGISNRKPDFNESPNKISNRLSDFRGSSHIGHSNRRFDFSDYGISNREYDSTASSDYGISNGGSASTESSHHGFSYIVYIVPAAVLILGLIIFILYRCFYSKRKPKLSKNQSKKPKSKKSKQLRKEFRHQNLDYMECDVDADETNLSLQAMEKKYQTEQSPITINSTTISELSGFTLDENGRDTAYEGDTEEIELLPQTNKRKNQYKLLTFATYSSTMTTSTDFTCSENDRYTKEAEFLEKPSDMDVYYLAMTEPSTFSSDESYESLNDYDNLSLSSTGESYDSAKDCVIDVHG